MKRPLIARIWGEKGLRLLFGDLLVIGLLALGVFASAAPKVTAGRQARAEVEVGGKYLTDLDLTRDGVSDVVGPLGETRLEVLGGRVRLFSSPCPRQTCRYGGWIGSAGEMLVCLPNQVVVRIPGQLPGATDAIAR